MNTHSNHIVVNLRGHATIRLYQIAALSLLITIIFCTATNASDMNEALVEAARNGQTDKVRVLLAAEADVSVRNMDGETALIIAIKNENAEMQRLLKNASAKELTNQARISYYLH